MLIGICLPLLCFSSTDAKLKAVHAKISHVRTEIKSANDQRSRLNALLRRAETHISSLQTQLDQTQAQLKQTSSKLQQLQAEQTSLLSHITEQQQRLANQIKSSYMLGQEPFLKILLNGHNPEKQQRMLSYFHYFNLERIHTIHQLQDLLAQLAKQQQAIVQNQKALQALSSKQDDEKSALEASQQQRHRVVKRLNKSIASRQQQLHALIKNEQSLKQAISHAQKMQTMTSTEHFSKLKGKLSWPLSGKHLNRYGARIDDSQLVWDGVVIKARSGQEIKAIAAGKVIFAKWLPGYGKLIIVSHGQGYMTLYGRCQALYKPVGAQINQGDIIATAGNTGGFSYTSLYFAIRKSGKPLNPALWCKHNR